MKNQIAFLLEKTLKEKGLEFKKEEIEDSLEIPPSSELGDYAFPCFMLSRLLKKSPNEIAVELESQLKPTKEIEKIKSIGSYLNFFINKKEFSKKILKEILSKKDNFGKLEKNGKKVVIESPGPNTNKPLHLGHLRNMAIGASISNIVRYFGNEVKNVDIINDRGIHICKSMLAYKKWGDNKKPKIKPDHFVGNFYVLYSKKQTENPKLEEEVTEILKKWEAGDKEIRALWKKMNSWALKGIRETYGKFGVKTDKAYYESDYYEKGKNLVFQGYKKGIFKKDSDGSIFIDLGKDLGKKILLRADGTSIYITQDLYLAKKRYEDYRMDRMIYVVGSEQIHHFKALFKILEFLKFKFAENCYHLSYGMIRLPEGKMKSREGTVVDADYIIEEVQELAKKELEKRNRLTKKELEEKSLKIALAAIKYMLLKIDVVKDIVFDPKESVSFDGNTGPYIQYSYARANSILKKAKTKSRNFMISNLEQKEFELVKKLSQFPEAVSDSYKNLNPSNLANYSYQLAQIFNEFYHAYPVIDSNQEAFRISLVKSFAIVIKTSLTLLGIPVLEEM